MDFKIDFIGIGATRSGSTWLTDCLNQHPEVYIPKIKEITFFNRKLYDRNYLKGINWYKSFFKKAPKNSVKGEFSTHYMVFGDAALLIKRHFPHIKLLVCLRNPADMLYSLYWWTRSTFEVNEIPDTFEEALEFLPEFKLRGMYFKQLQPYYQLFNRDQIKVIIFDDIKSKPSKVLEDLYGFLGIDNKFRPSIVKEKVNKGKQVRSKHLAHIIRFCVQFARKHEMNTQLRNLTHDPFLGRLYSMLTKKNFEYPEMKISTRRKINKMVFSDIEKLERLINKDLNMWKACK